MSSRLRQWAVLALMSSLVIASLQSAAHATVIGTAQYLDAIDRQAVLDRIDGVLAREAVQKQLKQLGVSPQDAAARVQSLTDQELMLLATRLESLPAGGDLLGVVGVVFVVLLILELVGVIDIFNRI